MGGGEVTAMMPKLLTVRVSRRAVAVAQITDEALTFAIGQHLTSRGDRAVASVTRFITRIVEATSPSLVVIDTPLRPPGSVTDRIMTAIESVLTGRGVQILSVRKAELLAAYGLTSLPSRDALRHTVANFWPELAQIVGRVQPYVADAAAAALYADTRLHLERVPT